MRISGSRSWPSSSDQTYPEGDDAQKKSCPQGHSNTYIGPMVCFRPGRCSLDDSNASRARATTDRVSVGSITSST